METRPSVGREVPFEEFGEGLLEVMVVPAKVPVVVAVLDVDDVVLDDVAVSLSAGRMDMAAGEFKRCVVDPFVECVLVEHSRWRSVKGPLKMPLPAVCCNGTLGVGGNQQSRQQSWKYRRKRTKQGVFGGWVSQQSRQQSGQTRNREGHK